MGDKTGPFFDERDCQTIRILSESYKSALQAAESYARLAPDEPERLRAALCRADNLGALLDAYLISLAGRIFQPPY